MLWTIFLLLMILWLLGMVTSYTLGGLYSHLADIGSCHGIDTHHSRTKSNLARAVTTLWSMCF